MGRTKGLDRAQTNWAAILTTKLSEEKTMRIRVLVADDHQIVRQGLKHLIETQQDMEVVGEAEDGRTILKLTRELTPNVIVMEVKLPNLNGIEATRKILSELPDIKIIALSAYADGHLVTNMLKAGACGYLLKDCAFEELAQAIRLAMGNKAYLSPRIAEIVVKDYVSQVPGQSQSYFAALTPRELEVLQLLTGGKRTSQIADVLHISVKTVDTHRQQIMYKLGTRSLAELTKYAIREGLTTLEN
jgi:DNA-binding NarL/FixJ family response regulator